MLANALRTRQQLCQRFIVQTLARLQEAGENINKFTLNVGKADGAHILEQLAWGLDFAVRRLDGRRVIEEQWGSALNVTIICESWKKMFRKYIDEYMQRFKGSSLRTWELPLKLLTSFQKLGSDKAFLALEYDFRLCGGYRARTAIRKWYQLMAFKTADVLVHAAVDGHLKNVTKLYCQNLPKVSRLQLTLQ